MAMTERMWQNKIERIRWKTVGEAFEGEMWVNRTPYGNFIVKFTLQIGGQTAVEIDNRDFPSLYWEKDFPTFKAAKAGVIQRMGEIEKLIAKTAAKNAEIRQYYCELLNEAIRKYGQS